MEDDIKDISDYTIARMPVDEQKPNLFGLHLGKNKIIYINMDAINTLPEEQRMARFINTLRHEIEHALQEKSYNELVKNKNLLKKDLEVFKKLAEEQNKKLPLQTLIKQYNQHIDKIAMKRNLTNYEIVKLKDYAELKVVNKQKTEYYKKYKNLIDNYQVMTKELSDSEALDIYNNLSALQKQIINEYDRLFKNYYNAKYENNARNIGQQKTEEIIKNAIDVRRHSDDEGIREQRNVRTRPRDSFKTPDRKTKSRAGQNFTAGEASEEISPEQFGKTNKTPQTREDEINIEKSGRDKIYEWHADIETKRFDVNKTLQSTINISKSIAKEYSKTTGQKISDKMVREILPFLRERTEVPEALGRKDLSKFYNSLTKQDITRLTKFADDVCGKFDKYWQNYKEVKGILTDEDIENHISHIWKTNKTQKGMLTNFFQTNSKFAKPRTIETLVKGIEQGYEPKTLDIAEILRIQSNSLIKAAADTNLANAIKNMRYGKKLLVQQGVKAPADWVEINHPALNKAVYQGELDNGGALMSKQSVKVHPALADVIAPVFETQKPDNKFWKAYDIVNGTLKQVQMGFSGFHGYALSESAIGNIGLRQTAKSINPIEISIDIPKSNNTRYTYRFYNNVFYFGGISGYVNNNTANNVYTFVTLSQTDGWSSASGSLEQPTNKVTSLSSSSTNTQYPSAKCVWDNCLHSVSYDSSTQTLTIG